MPLDQSHITSTAVGAVTSLPNGGASGQVLAKNSSTDGDASWTNQSGGAQALNATAVKTSAYSAAAGDFVPVDCTSADVTVTLPTAPADKTRVCVKLIAVSGHTCTVACGGSDVFNKAAGSTTGTMTLLNQALMLQYASSSAIWYVQSTDAPLSGLDARYLNVSNNLSDVPSPSTARTSLGLGTAATLASTAVLAVANNLSDLGSASTARTNLGLGSDKGAWVTATAYIAGDQVTRANTGAGAAAYFGVTTGIRYMCISAHTSSAAFHTDLSAGRWVRVGSPVVYSTIATAESTNTQTGVGVDLTTVGPSVTLDVPTNGIVAIQAVVTTQGDGTNGAKVYVCDDGSTVTDIPSSGTDIQLISYTTNSSSTRYSTTQNTTGSGRSAAGPFCSPYTAGAKTFTLKYGVTNSALTATFSSRQIWAWLV